MTFDIAATDCIVQYTYLGPPSQLLKFPAFQNRTVQFGPVQKILGQSSSGLFRRSLRNLQQGYFPTAEGVANPPPPLPALVKRNISQGQSKNSFESN